MIRLHLNENTSGPSPAVVDALRDLGAPDYAFYAEDGRIRQACERHLGVGAGWVAMTNGLDEGLYAAAYASRLAAQDFEAIVVEPAFEMYGIAIAVAGGRQITVMSGPHFEFPEAAIRAGVTTQTRLIYLCDPNNPTGLPIPAGAIERLAADAPRALILVDEAYADYSGTTFIPRLDRFRNVIVGRTFAKAHGLAALRIGALIGHPDALAPLRRVLPPYNVNVCAMTALDAALADESYTRRCADESRESRALIYAWCESRGIEYWPSSANFVLMRVGDAGSLVRHMAANGVLIRDKSKAPGCTGCVRITANRADETRLALRTMEGWHASSAN